MASEQGFHNLDLDADLGVYDLDTGASVGTMSQVRPPSRGLDTGAPPPVDVSGLSPLGLAVGLVVGVLVLGGLFAALRSIWS